MSVMLDIVRSRSKAPRVELYELSERVAKIPPRWGLRIGQRRKDSHRLRFDDGYELVKDIDLAPEMEVERRPSNPGSAHNALDPGRTVPELSDPFHCSLNQKPARRAPVACPRWTVGYRYPVPNAFIADGFLCRVQNVPLLPLCEGETPPAWDFSCHPACPSQYASRTKLVSNWLTRVLALATVVSKGRSTGQLCLAGNRKGSKHATGPTGQCFPLATRGEG